ncbi:hypothetical protein N7540_013133 [Penicillium herquei]|nr:hypothetical protein N7540_013133 [Penicillium herquei]
MSGISDAAGTDGHPLIHNTEAEERLHECKDDAKKDARKHDGPETTRAGGAEAGHKESTLEKVKEAFHRQARRAESGP